MHCANTTGRSLRSGYHIRRGYKYVALIQDLSHDEVNAQQKRTKINRAQTRAKESNS